MAYLTGSRRSEGEHVSKSRDDVNGEANEERSNGGVDRAKEREDYSQKPDGNNHRQSCSCPFAQALTFMHSNGFLPHKVQRSASKSKCNELQELQRKYVR